ncbi:protein-disulfide isomerase [Cupriavidus basilensis OR16]|uniref:Protein-disulfide isomerase n=1 Tax=Cupriavidus basilensis OR16 TaxID=1127483 RepID=H1SES1_9BURK|nr:DsbA family protein [Cupriavidus basilensis]EHP38997.1 protein-disulfide isomerase [Cupriavidus basilensis OR16]
MDKQATLHYVYDPFCGWCYGLAPLVLAADEAGLRVVPHSGGMLAGERAQNMSAEWRDFVRPHEERITALSGQPFSETYQQGTQFDYDVRLDSGPPTAAMLAAESVGGAGLKMLERLQVAYYREGRPIAERSELIQIAEELGLDAASFANALDQASATLPDHFAQTQALLEEIGGHGYPALAIEQGGKISRLRTGRYFGKPELFRKAMEEVLAQ